MSSEKSYILKMVESGKISVDDAVKLIDALKDSDEEEKASFWESIEFEEKLDRFASSTESFAKDIGVKMNSTWKDVEPKFKSAAKVAVEKTASAVDKLSCILSDYLKSFEDKGEHVFDECEEHFESNDNEPREN